MHRGGHVVAKDVTEAGFGLLELLHVEIECQHRLERAASRSLPRFDSLIKNLLRNAQ